MTLEERNLELTRQLYARSGSGDWDAVEAMLTDDFVAVEAPGLPYAGEFRGKGGLRELFTKVMGMIDARGLDLKQMTAGGDWVIVLVDILTRDENGDELRLSLAEGTQFRDGKVCAIVPYYFDPAQVHRAVNAKAAAA